MKYELKRVRAWSEAEELAQEGWELVAVIDTMYAEFYYLRRKLKSPH